MEPTPEALAAADEWLSAYYGTPRNVPPAAEDPSVVSLARAFDAFTRGLPADPPANHVRLEMAVLVWHDGNTDVYPVRTGPCASDIFTYEGEESRAIARMAAFPASRPAHIRRVVVDLELPVATVEVVGKVQS